MADKAQDGGKFKPVQKRTKDLALDYLERHLWSRYIFPVKRGAKFPPLLRDNLEQASNDPAQIIAWEKKWPGCNWAVAHRKSNLLVADVDTNQAKGKRGQETYDMLDMLYGWPDTEITTTPSGGHHHVYVGEHIMALGENGIGLDIDSPNYTLIPGCTFDDGTSYVGNDAEAVPCPEWIYDTIKNSKAKARIADAGDVVVELDQPANIELAIDFLQQDAEPAIEGQGGDFNTLKTAMYLKDLGISPQLAPDLLNEYYNPRCTPPWDMDDLIKKVSNAYSYSTLSKVGGKTAEADFADDPPEPTPPMSPLAKKQKAARKEDREQGIKKPPKYNRKRVIYNPTNLTQSLHDAMMAVRADKVHDHIFRRGPELVRLNQAVTQRDLEGEKPTDIKRKRGALMIATVVRDYMKLRLDQAAKFHVKKAKKKKTETETTEKETANASI